MIKGSQTVIINERTVLSVIWRGDDVCYSYRSPDPAIDAFKSHAPADREYCGLLMLCRKCYCELFGRCRSLGRVVTERDVSRRRVRTSTRV